MKIPVDILASYSSKFHERKAFKTLENKIMREGVALYERKGFDNSMVQEG